MTVVVCKHNIAFLAISVRLPPMVKVFEEMIVLLNELGSKKAPNMIIWWCGRWSVSYYYRLLRSTLLL